MNRLKEYFGEPPEPERTGDFFEIDSYSGSFAVSREAAVEIERSLDALPPPRWIVFTDLAGSRHRMLTEQIRCISESTSATRAADRAFQRERRQEDKKDRRPWE